MDRGNERRRYHRARVPDVQGTQLTPGDVEVLDLSLTGMALETRRQLTPGEHCFLELRHDRHTVSVEAEVRWAYAYRVEKSSEALRPVFRAGVSFVDIVQQDQGGIWDWLLVEEPGTQPVSH